MDLQQTMHGAVPVILLKIKIIIIITIIEIIEIKIMFTKIK